MSATLVRLFYRHSILALTTVFIVGSTLVVLCLAQLFADTTEQGALREARRLASTRTEFRTLYTREVVARVRPLGVMVTHDYASHAGAIPLPATLSMELGQSIGRRGSGAHAELDSPYPFPWRKDIGGLDAAFKKKAWSAIACAPTASAATIPIPILPRQAGLSAMCAAIGAPPVPS